MDKIICVGKNYLKHAIELGDAVPEEPLYFLKPPSSSIQLNQGKNLPVELPARREVHHELELVLELQHSPQGWSVSQFTFGLDLTDRELQARLKKAGQPWEKAKVFSNAAILGPWRRFSTFDEILALPFELKVNGQVRQSGVGADMRWKPLELIQDLAHWFPLKDGDLLFTGTPEGVGPLRDKDLVEVAGGKIQYSFECQVNA